MEKEEEEIRCQVMWQLNQDKKYEEVVDHLLTGCLNCITNPKKRFNGKEMLFPDAPPSWIKIPESEKSNPDAWKKYQKKHVHVQMTPEEFDQFLIDSDYGDEQICHEIARFKRVERVAAWAMTREIRKKQKEKRMEIERKERELKKKDAEAKREAEKLKKLDEKRKILEKKQQKDDEKQEYLDKMQEEEKLLEEVIGEEKEEPEIEIIEKPIKKEYNLKDQMPWSPSTFDILCSEQRSCIDHSQQKRMIAMCQNLMYSGALQHASNKRELKDIRKAAETEYDTLVAAALQHARNEACHPIDFLTEKTIGECFNSFKRREPKHQNAHYLFKNPIFTVEKIAEATGIRSETQAVIPKMEKLLRKSKWNDELIIPDISKKCAVGKNKKLLPMKTRLSDDSIAMSLISTYPSVSVMMDATTACHLLTPNWESRDYEFGIPIEVKEQRIDGITKKFIVLSKPMPSNTITKSSLQRKTLKRLLRSQFVKRRAPHQQMTKPAPQPTPEVSTSSESSESSQSTTSSQNNLLDDLINQMQRNEEKFQKKMEKPMNSEDNSYQYAIFRVGDARLLVRSNAPYSKIEMGEKKHTFIKDEQKITFEPRIEYLPNGGSMDLGAPEWIWNYTKGIMKMSDSHVLYRTSYRLDHILQIDALTMRLDLQQSPPPDAFGLLSARCLMFEKLIGQLETLETGEYMAFQETNKPLVVVPKCDPELQRDGVSLEAMRITEIDIKKVSETIGDDYFHGFSPDVAFQWQIVQGRAPLLLLAQDSPLIGNMPSKNNREKLQRRKTHIKRKFQKYEAKKDEAKRHKTIDLDDPNLYADFTNPAVVPMKFTPKNYSGGGGGRGGAFRGRGRPRGGKFRGRGRGGGFGRGGGANGGGGASGGGEGGPSTSQVPQIP